MIDLILRASTRADLVIFAKANRLMAEEQEVITDPETGEKTRQGTGEWSIRRGVEWSPWNGTGKLMRSPAVIDAEGNEATPAQFVPGYVALLRIALPDDQLTGDEEGYTSKVMRYIRKNGTLGTQAGLPYAEIDGVRLYRREDVDAKLAEWGVPSHTFL